MLRKSTLEASKTSRNTGMALLAIPAILLLCQACKTPPSAYKINRYELVSRHNILVEQFDSLSSLSIGNGDFAFTTDITGLQTFYEAYSGGIPLGTQSNWGWHVNSNPENYELSESVKVYKVNGRDVPYLHQYSGGTRQARSSEYFRANPHRLHLGFIRLMMLKENGSLAEIGDIRFPKQRLDLWQGKITSEFIFENEPVRVEVFCHQSMDLIAARIESSLSTAQKWRQRLGMGRNAEWDKILSSLALPAASNGLYLGTANTPDSYTNKSKMRDHPVVLGSYGMLPFREEMDTAIMHNTLDTILLHWDWSSTWGWDYPMIGMTAARLNEPEKAIEILLKNVPKNTYLLNGHNYQSSRLRIYLPGNGGFLTAIAMMCAGWEGCETDLPGFPKDGKWNVKWENISRMF